MLRRFLLALLIACLAVPAAAMPLLHPEGAEQRVTAPSCHETASMADHQAADTHAPAAPDGAKQPHDCIGCAVSWPTLPAEPAVMPMYSLSLPPALVPVLHPHAGMPEVPPPKA